MRTLALTSALAATAVILAVTPSAATTNDFGIDIYMSAPTVQGTAVTTGLSFEDFNSFAAGTCPADIAIGAVSGGCEISEAGTYGGATADADDATPTTGGSGSNYAFTAGESSSLTIDLTEPARYLGIWWSAGSPSNTVELYSGDDRVASMSTATLMTLLQTGSVSTVGGATVNTADYNGNPRDTGLASGEPFIYLNLFGNGGAAFDRIVLSGSGFEFDNIAVSDLEQAPGTDLVGVEFIPGENAPDAPEELAETGVNAAPFVALAALFSIAGILASRRRLS